MELSDNMAGYGSHGQPPMPPEELAAEVDARQGIISAELGADGPFTDEELARLRARLDND